MKQTQRLDSVRAALNRANAAVEPYGYLGSSLRNITVRRSTTREMPSRGM